MARAKKVKIYINGTYLESCKELSVAEAKVRWYEKQDRYEIDVCGYTNKLPVYEIRQ